MTAPLAHQILFSINTSGLSLPSMTTGPATLFDRGVLDLDILFDRSRVPDIRPSMTRAELEPLAPLGTGATGAEATVHRTRLPGLLAKMYRAPAGLNTAALTAAVAWRRRLSRSERYLVDRYTCWPLATITDTTGVVGVVVAQAPASFQHHRGLLELQFLAEPRYAQKLGYGLPGTAARLRLARDLAAIVTLFERHDITHGDFSYRNLLYSMDDSGIYVLDCDGVQMGATPAITTPRPASPEWVDPDRPAGGPDLETGRWQLALAIARILGRCRQHPTTGSWMLYLPATLGVHKPIIRRHVTAGLGPRGGRPTAGDWHQLLTSMTP